MRMRERCACGAEVEVEDNRDEHFEASDHLVVREWRIRHAQKCLLPTMAAKSRERGSWSSDWGSAREGAVALGKGKAQEPPPSTEEPFGVKAT